MSDFSSIARIDRQTATAQKSAAGRPFWMLRIERTDDVMDLGCGTGHQAGAHGLGDVLIHRLHVLARKP